MVPPIPAHKLEEARADRVSRIRQVQDDPSVVEYQSGEPGSVVKEPNLGAEERGDVREGPESLWEEKIFVDELDLQLGPLEALEEFQQQSGGVHPG